LREDREECEESNDDKKRREETSFASNMVENPTDENMRDCKCRSCKSEAKKCENNEILKRELSDLIAEVKKKDSTHTNKKVKRWRT